MLELDKQILKEKKKIYLFKSQGDRERETSLPCAEWFPKA